MQVRSHLVQVNFASIMQLVGGIIQMGLGLMLMALAVAKLRRLTAASFWCTLAAGALVIASVAVFRSISITMQTLDAGMLPGWYLAFRIGSLVYRVGILSAFALVGLAVASLLRRPKPATGGAS